MTSASLTLRPLSLPELLDQAVRLYRRNFLKFIGILALPLIPATGIQVLGSLVSLVPLALNPDSARFDSSDPLTLMTSFAAQSTGTILYGLLLQGVATPALVRAVADAYFGQSVGILDTYRKIGSAWFQIIIVLILAFVLNYVLAFWMLVPCVGWFTGVGISWFYSLVVMQLVTPVIMLEKHVAFQSLRRAWDLARRRFWWLLGFGLVMGLFVQALSGGPAVLLGAFLLGLFTNLIENGSPALFFSLQTTAQTLTTLLISLFYFPMNIIAFTLVYLDLRVRTEGLDLALRAEEALGGSSAVEVVGNAPGPERGRLITRREWGYFVILTLGFLLVFALIFLPFFFLVLLPAFAGF